MSKPKKEKKIDITALRAEAKEAYSAIKSVHCPYFGETITFNSEGFNHLRYKNARSERDLKTQEMRYKLIKLAPQVVRLSKTIQEYQEEKLFIEVRKNKKRETVLRLIKFHGFIAIINHRKVKVIVRQVEKGPLHFWSIIPAWQTRKSAEGASTYLNYTGSLSKD